MSETSYYASHREERKAYARSRRKLDPQRDRDACASWRAANPERNKAVKAAWYAANPIRAAAAKQAWKERNIDLVRSLRRVDEARRRSAKTGRLSPNLADQLMERQNAICPSCGGDLCPGFHLDHKIPLARGGPNLDHNIQLLCPRCNCSKGKKLEVELTCYVVGSTG